MRLAARAPLHSRLRDDSQQYKHTVDMSSTVLYNGNIFAPGNFDMERTVVGLFDPLNACTFDWQIAMR